MRDFHPAHGGKLILWHGEAGTGKTFALRALAWEWRDWCEFNYIVDPDSFFGEHADYLMSVLTQPGYARCRTRASCAWRSERLRAAADPTTGDEGSKPGDSSSLEDKGEAPARPTRSP